MPSRRAGGPVVVFDIDGTLLDSAVGIITGFRYALRSVGFEPPSEQVLRADLGPPVGQIFTALGLPAELLAEAVLAYRAYYFANGLQQSHPYDGIRELLQALHQHGVRMATATAKRTDVARAIIDHHGLGGFFEAVNGSEEHRLTKTATLDQTLDDLGRPPVAHVLMVGDRHSDITAAVNCGVVPVAVSWGYGSSVELRATGARLIDSPHELLSLPLFEPQVATARG